MVGVEDTTRWITTLSSRFKKLVVQALPPAFAHFAIRFLGLGFRAQVHQPTLSLSTKARCRPRCGREALDRRDDRERGRDRERHGERGEREKERETERDRERGGGGEAPDTAPRSPNPLERF